MFGRAIEAVFPRGGNLETLAEDGICFGCRGVDFLRHKPVWQQHCCTRFGSRHRVSHRVQSYTDLVAGIVAALGPVVRPLKWDIRCLKPVVDRGRDDGPGHALKLALQNTLDRTPLLFGSCFIYPNFGCGSALVYSAWPPGTPREF